MNYFLLKMVDFPGCYVSFQWCTLPETNIAHENHCLHPGKYHQNG